MPSEDLRDRRPEEAANARAGRLPFSPFSFVPDRNDRLQIQVTTESGQSCTMAFKKAWL